ncbi:MAG TPA: response regulator transcription factor [Pseudonocardiaceae bacterium]|nr:response regulator transcription factor [Pseudonocardiaceae bacterium]
MIVAEDTIMCDLLAMELRRQGLDVIGSARTTMELLRLVDADSPDIVILDLHMPLDENHKPEFIAGLDAAKRIRTRHRRVALLILSNYSSPFWVDEVVSLGPAVGYQLKDRVQDMTHLMDDIRAVAAGGTRIDQTLLESWKQRKQVSDPIQGLTEQQRAVLWLMAKGLSNAEIQKKLSLMESTIEGHERTIYAKLGLSRLPEDEQTRINRRVKAVLTLLSSNNPTINLDDPNE